MATQAERAAARATMLEGFLAEVTGARTIDEVRAVWVRALRTTTFCLLPRPARERLFGAAADAIAHIRNFGFPHDAETHAGGDKPGTLAGSSGTTVR
jgi:hypothetical protein